MKKKAKVAAKLEESLCKCSYLSPGCEHCTAQIGTTDAVNEFDIGQMDTDEQCVLLKVKRQNLSENKKVKI